MKRRHRRSCVIRHAAFGCPPQPVTLLDCARPQNSRGRTLTFINATTYCATGIPHHRGAWRMAAWFLHGFRLAVTFVLLLAPARMALAWDADGHQIVGAIADSLVSRNAKQQVASILGVSLSTAGPWLDCVKSVHRYADGTFHYVVEPDYEKPCEPFAKAHTSNETSSSAATHRAGRTMTMRSTSRRWAATTRITLTTSRSSATASIEISRAPTIMTLLRR